MVKIKVRKSELDRLFEWRVKTLLKEILSGPIKLAFFALFNATEKPNLNEKKQYICILIAALSLSGSFWFWHVPGIALKQNPD